MNDALGFQEMQASIFRSPSSRLLHEQRHQFGTGSWQFLDTHDFIALSTGISPKREEVPEAVFMPKIGSILRQTLFKNRVEKME